MRTNEELLIADYWNKDSGEKSKWASMDDYIILLGKNEKIQQELNRLKEENEKLKVIEFSSHQVELDRNNLLRENEKMREMLKQAKDIIDNAKWHYDYDAVEWYSKYNELMGEENKNE